MNLKAFTNSFIQYYERIIAVIVMLLLVVLSACLVVRVGTLQTQIQTEDLKRPKDVEPKLDGHQKFVDSVAPLKDPPSWNAVGGTNTNARIFIGPYMKLLNRETGFPDPYPPGDENNRMAPSGLPYAWLKKYNLAAKDPGVGEIDPDGDGFTVREEFKAGTDPVDPNSRPDVALKLRVSQLVQPSFPFKFNGIAEGATVKFEIQKRNGKSEFVKLNEIIPDAENPGWKVVDYKEKFEDRIDRHIKDKTGKALIVKVDISEVTLEKEGAKPFILRKRQMGNTDELFARLYFILEEKYFDVGVGAEFTLQKGSYKLQSIKNVDNKPEVVVKRQDSGTEFNLLRLSQEDLNKPQTGTGTPAGQGWQPGRATLPQDWLPPGAQGRPK